jgi:hypothetical protein
MSLVAGNSKRAVRPIHRACCRLWFCPQPVSCAGQTVTSYRRGTTTDRCNCRAGECAEPAPEGSPSPWCCACLEERLLPGSLWPVASARLRKIFFVAEIRAQACQTRTMVCRAGRASAKGRGVDDASILDSVITTALGRMHCTLADGLHPDIDPGLTSAVPSEPPQFPESFDWADSSRPYLQQQTRPADELRSYAFFREQFGFV